MTTTAVQTRCPAWCTHHLNDDYPGDEFDGVVHCHTIRVQDAVCTIQQTTGQRQGLDPDHAIVTGLDFEWISEETIRHYAQVLSQAADLLGIRE